jgi:Flp pilus assembly protein TadG
MKLTCGAGLDQKELQKLNIILWDALRRRLGWLARSTGRFWRDDQGNIALLTALLIVPLVLAVGMSIDLAFAWQSRQNVQQLSDEISTITTSTARDYLATNGVSQIAAATTAANTQAQALCTDFTSKNKQLSSIQCGVTLSLQGLVVYSTSTVSASYNTFFMQIVGSTQIAYSATANAQASLPPYIDFYMLLDNSPSMGIGATVADMNLIANNTGGCEFACHDTNPNESGSNTYQTAKNAGATLRIDQVKTAAQSLLTYAGQQSYANRYRIAAYSFGDQAYPGKIGLKQLSALNGNFSQVSTALSSLDLMWIATNNDNNNDDSDIDGNLTALANQIPAPGDGSSTAKSLKVIFLVTDGAADIAPPNPGNNRYWSWSGIYPGSWSNPCVTTYNDYDGNHCMQPVTVSVCSAIKAKNILIAALYTTYFKYSNSVEYPTYIQPIASAIPANLQACASPGLYFEVNPQTTGLNQAMQTLFQAAINQATRLTK